MILVLLRPEPDWWGALSVAMTLPPGMSERRANDDPWSPAPINRPRRITDDLAWFRHAFEHPADHGLYATDPRTWELDLSHEDLERLHRLSDRGVLEAAGFALE